MNKAHDMPRPDGPATFEKALEELYENLEAYKKVVDHMDGKELKTSDRKKLLALPFYLHKRRELPEPKPGQKEWTLFSEMYG